MSRRRRGVAALAGALLGTGLAACAPTPPASAPTATTAPTTGRAAATTCPAEAPLVRTADELRSALRSTGPGTVVRLAPGVFPGRFTIGGAALPDRPAVLCGGPDSVLDGGAPDAGTTLRLDHAAHWHVVGITVRGGKKGVMVDASPGVVLDGLSVSDVGDEAVHLRAGTSDALVRRVTVRRTGLRRAEFGEGVYVGTARSNWCEVSACGPDRSDRVVVEDVDVADTTAEAVDVKEGTTGGVLRGSRFSGARTIAADSWVDVKGNDWTVVDNVGVAAPRDGFQVHEVVDGWGRGAVFARNTAVVDAAGYGVNVAAPPGLPVVVACSNRVSGAAAGASSVPCR